METQDIAMLFILALIVFAIWTTIAPGQNIFTAVKGNFTQNRTTISSMATELQSVSIAPVELGSNYRYDISVNVRLEIEPEQDNDIEIVPVIEFKDISTRTKPVGADYIIIKRGEKAYYGAINQQITTRVPPRRFADDQNPWEVSLVEGEECLFKADSEERPFIVKLYNTAESPFYNPVCRASFFIECKDEVKKTNMLKKCEDINTPDNACGEIIEVCGTDVTLKVKRVECGTRNADIVMSYDGNPVPDWAPKEEMKIKFFLRSECVESASDVSNLEQKCTKDFLNTIVYKHDLLGGVC